jgi:hypothetical protein
VVIQMSMFAKLPVLMAVAATLAGCTSGLGPYNGNPNTVIATASDTGVDKIGLQDGGAAIAYDPDGCQGWIMDDGVEGYSGRRFDPVSGLPICNNHFPPGTVVRNYQTGTAGINDYVPGNRTN